MVDVLWAVRRHMVTRLLLYTARRRFRQNSTARSPESRASRKSAPEFAAARDREQEQEPAVHERQEGGGRADRRDHPLTEVVRCRLPSSVRPAVAMRRLPAAAAVAYHRAVRRGPCAR